MHNFFLLHLCDLKLQPAQRKIGIGDRVPSSVNHSEKNLAKVIKSQGHRAPAETCRVCVKPHLKRG